MGIPMLKIRRPVGRLIFNMGITIPSKTVFLIETAPCFPWVLPNYWSSRKFLGNMPNFVMWTVSADSLAPSCARPAAGTVNTKFIFLAHICQNLELTSWWITCCCRRCKLQTYCQIRHLYNWILPEICLHKSLIDNLITHIMKIKSQELKE